MKLIKKYLEKLRALENREQDVLVSSLPSWYIIYQYNFFFRLSRLLALVVLASTWYASIIAKIIKTLNLKFLLENISTENYLSIYSFIFIFCIIYLFIHCIFNMIIRIVLFKKIVKNSPISIAQCISTGLRICRYGSYCLAVFLGIPGIDYTFERNGNVAPFRGYYIKQHIQYFGANDVNCAVTEGEILQKDGIINTFLSNQQNYTRQQETKINYAYNLAKSAGDTPKVITEKVVSVLTK